MHSIKYTITDKSNRTFFEIYVPEKQIFLRFNYSNELVDIKYIEEKDILNYIRNSFGEKVSFKTSRINLRESLVEKAVRTMKAQDEVDKHFRIIQENIHKDFHGAKEHFMKISYDFYEKEDYENALKYLIISKEYRNDSEIYVNMARCNIKMNRFDIAIENIKTAITYGFNYMKIFDYNCFEKIINHPKFVEIIKVEFDKNPDQLFSVNMTRYLYRHGIMKLDDPIFKIDKKPDSFEKRPDLFEKRPDLFEKRPDSFEKRPDLFEKRPDLFEKRPDSFEKRPDSFDNKYSEQSYKTPEQQRSIMVIPNIKRSRFEDFQEFKNQEYKRLDFGSRYFDNAASIIGAAVSLGQERGLN
jgi:tetratricopeptide (TPR) repeat protein